MSKFAFTFLIFFLFGAVSASSAQTADFLIVENPARLSIFNQYQQTLSSEARREFKSFTPFRIIDESGLLSDGLTPVIKSTLNGRVFYILKDDENNLAGIDKAGYTKFFRRCRIFADTVQVLADNRMSLRPAVESSFPNIALRKGELLVRLFKTGSDYYVLHSGPEAAFGWTRPGSLKNWAVFKAAQDRRLLVIPDKLKLRIATRIASANRSYIDFFDHFNRVTGNRSPVPEWQLIEEDHRIRYQLSNLSIAHKLKHSSEYLVRDLENMLLGTGISLKYETGSIAIFLDSGSRQ